MKLYTELVGFSDLKEGDNIILDNNLLEIDAVIPDTEDCGWIDTNPSKRNGSVRLDVESRVKRITTEKPIPKPGLCVCGCPDDSHIECIDFTAAHGCLGCDDCPRYRMA